MFSAAGHKPATLSLAMQLRRTELLLEWDGPLSLPFGPEDCTTAKKCQCCCARPSSQSRTIQCHCSFSLRNVRPLLQRKKYTSVKCVYIYIYIYIIYICAYIYIYIKLSGEYARTAPFMLRVAGRRCVPLTPPSSHTYLIGICVPLSAAAPPRTGGPGFGQCQMGRCFSSHTVPAMHLRSLSRLPKLAAKFPHIAGTCTARCHAAPPSDGPMTGTLEDAAKNHSPGVPGGQMFSVWSGRPSCTAAPDLLPGRQH